MKKYIQYTLLVTSFFLFGCSTAPQNVVYQESTVDALLSGVYDGELPLEQLRKHGHFGIGTFDRLDGEMVLLDG